MLYKGAKGRGKTLTMVKDGYKYLKDGWAVYSNMTSVKFAHHLTGGEILKLNKETDIYNACLIIDEIQIYFDSRKSTSTNNRNFSNFVQQIRKRNIKLLSATQYVGTVDLRFRQHANIVVRPKLVYIEHKPICEVTYLDMDSIEDDLENGTLTDPIETTVVYDPKPIFSLYDTDEVII